MSKLRELLFQPETVSLSGIATDKSDTGLKLAPLASASKLSLSGLLTDRRTEGQSGEEGTRRLAYQNLKNRIHNRLIDSIDIQALIALDQSEPLEAAIERTVHALISEDKLPLTADECAQVARDVLYETLGLGPLEPLLTDIDINDILVNGWDNVWIDRDGKLEPTNIHFKDNDHLLHVITRIVARVGRRIDESSPIVDARLPDGSRVNAIIPPLALDGPSLSIRRFRNIPFVIKDLIARGTLSENMAEFLAYAVQARLNILNFRWHFCRQNYAAQYAFQFYVGDAERIVTIEDTAELRLQQRHVVRLESRPANIEGRGNITQRDSRKKRFANASRSH